MESRININEIEPQAYKAMYALEGYLATTQLSKTHKELIKIRASHIAQIIMAIVTINAWNRIAVSTQLAPGN